MKKTFWSVKYTGIGYNGTSTKWFDNLEDAIEFANEDYRDNPVNHTYSNSAKIKEIERIIEMQ